MACGGAPPLFVQPPAQEPVRFGLLSVAVLRDASDPHWRNGVEWIQTHCGAASAWACNCGETQPDKVATKGTETVEGEPFVLFGSHSCTPVGGTDYQSARERAIANLLSGEQRRLEQVFMSGELNQNPHLASTDTTDLTPAAGALSILDGLAVLESWLGDQMGTMGVLHGPRGLSPALAEASLVETVGNQKQTALGTPFALGAGYSLNLGPDGAAAPAGEAWIYATGTPQIWRSEIEVVPDDLGGGFDKGQNDLTVLAERTYVVGYECGAAAVRVRLGCACC